MLFSFGRSNQRNHLQCQGWSLAITWYAMASVLEPCEGSRHFIEKVVLTGNETEPARYIYDISFSSFLEFLNQHSREHYCTWAYLIADWRYTIDLFGDILLHCKWLNTLDSIVFIWSIYPTKIEVEFNENIFSMPDFLQNGICNLALNFYGAYQIINKINGMNTRLIQASRM